MTPVPQTAHLGGIQILRGLAALAVMVSHLLIIEGKYSADQILGNWAGWGAAGVDIFFAVSGFIMVYVTHNRDASRNRPAGFLASRIVRIYPLYWLVSAALLAVWLLRPDMVFSSAAGDPNIVKSFALWPDTREPLLAVGWTLIHEMYFYVVFAVFLLFARRWLPLLLLIWALIISAASIYNLRASSPELRLIFSPLTLEFILGAFAALAFTQSPKPQWQLALTLGLLFLGGAFLAGALGLHTLDFENQPVRVVLFAVPAALLAYGFAGFGAAKTAFAKFGEKLGDWSYALYLSHVLSLSLIGRIWGRFAREGIVDNIVMILVMSGFAIGVAAVLHHVFERPVLRVCQSGLRRFKLRA